MGIRGNIHRRRESVAKALDGARQRKAGGYSATMTKKVSGDQKSPYMRLAHFVRMRREELGMTQNQVQMAGGPSAAAVRYIEAGKETRPTARTINALERALGWTSGSIQVILDGGDPTVFEGAAEPFPVEEVTESLHSLQNMVAELESILESQRRAVVALATIDTATMDLARIVAGRERRSVTEVVSEALTLYSEVMGGEK